MKSLASLVIMFSVAASFSTSGWAAASASFTVHEWGTFTSLQDSEGKTIEGVAHEDEALPLFVHGRASTLLSQQKTLFQTSNSFDTDNPPPRPHGPTKDSEFLITAGTPTTVTQKMETPVIYFYAAQAVPGVKVDVDFPGGIITQYYPNVTDFSPPLGKVNAVANGHIHWDIDIAAQPLALPPVENTSIWAPSRRTQSNTISSGGENEKLLFYRGLGNFKTAVQILDDSHGGLQVQNHSGQNIADAFLLRVTPNGTTIRKLGGIGSHGLIALSKEEVTSLPESNALDLVASALEKSGLYPDEAQAMVHTWERSYFKTPGLRLLYVLPREWTDSLLPLTIQPQPSEIVRSLVGRVEVFTANEEASILDNLKSSFKTAPHSSTLPIVIQNLGRFGESKLRRLVQLAQKNNEPSAFIVYLGRLLSAAEQQ